MEIDKSVDVKPTDSELAAEADLTAKEKEAAEKKKAAEKKEADEKKEAAAAAKEEAEATLAAEVKKAAEEKMVRDLEKTLNMAAEAMNEVEKNGKDAAEKVLSNLNDSLLHITPKTNWNLSSAFSRDDIMSELKRITAALSSSIETFDRGSYENNTKLLENISNAALTRAVYLLPDSKFASRGLQKLIDFSKIRPLRVTNLSHSAISYALFSTSQAADSYVNGLTKGDSQTTGSLSAIGNISGVTVAAKASVSGGTAFSTEETTIYHDSITTASTVEIGSCIVNGFQFDNHEKIRLMSGAQSDLLKIQSEDDASSFLAAYGTHIPCGTQQLGGSFIRTTKLHFSKSVSKTEFVKAVSDVLHSSGSVAAMGPGFAVSSGVSHDRSNSSATVDSNVNQNEYYSSESSVNFLGPPVNNYSLFVNSLLASNKFFSLIDNGITFNNDVESGLLPIWQLIKITMPELSAQAKHLRNSFLRTVLTPTTDVHPFMVALVTYTLIHCFDKDEDDQKAQWTQSLEGRKKICERLLSVAPLLHTTLEQEGAYKSVDWLTTLPVGCDKPLTGFHLQLRANKLHYKYSTLQIQYDGDDITLDATDTATTKWTGYGNIDILLSHPVQAPPNCCLTSFNIEDNDKGVQYKYTFAKLKYGNVPIILGCETEIKSSWQRGLGEHNEYLSKLEFHVPENCVMTGFRLVSEDENVQYVVQYAGLPNKIVGPPAEKTIQFHENFNRTAWQIDSGGDLSNLATHGLFPMKPLLGLQLINDDSLQQYMYWHTDIRFGNTPVTIESQSSHFTAPHGLDVPWLPYHTIMVPEGRVLIGLTLRVKGSTAFYEYYSGKLHCAGHDVQLIPAEESKTRCTGIMKERLPILDRLGFKVPPGNVLLGFRLDRTGGYTYHYTHAKVVIK